MGAVEQIGFNGSFLHAIIAEWTFGCLFHRWHDGRDTMGPDGAGMEEVADLPGQRLNQMLSAR